MDNPWQEVMDDLCEALMRLADRVEKALEDIVPDYRTERAIEEGQKYEHHLDRQKHSARAVRAVRRSRRGIAKVQGCAGWGTTRPRHWAESEEGTACGK